MRICEMKCYSVELLLGEKKEESEAKHSARRDKPSFSE